MKCEISIKLNFSANMRFSRRKESSDMESDSDCEIYLDPPSLLPTSQSSTYSGIVLTSRCRCNCCCWDDWPMPVCVGAIGHAKQLNMAAWICLSGGPSSSACGLDRARSLHGSRTPHEASRVTSWSNAAKQNTPAPIRRHRECEDVILRTDGYKNSS